MYANESRQCLSCYRVQSGTITPFTRRASIWSFRKLCPLEGVIRVATILQQRVLINAQTLTFVQHAYDESLCSLKCASIAFTLEHNSGLIDFDHSMRNFLLIYIGHGEAMVRSMEGVTV